jgi:hypothetical protein
MTAPDMFEPDEMLRAVDRLRAAGVPPEVDDEDLALFVDGGIGAVPPVARAGLLRAVGQSPELAAVVAELSATRSAAVPAEPVVTRIGTDRTAWRVAWAACALLAVSLTAWIALGGGARPAPAEVGLLDAASPRGQGGQSFSDWFAGTPVRVLVAALWIALCFLTFPALPPARRAPAGRGGEGR